MVPWLRDGLVFSVVGGCGIGSGNQSRALVDQSGRHKKDDGSKTTQSFPSRLVRIRASVNCAVSCMHEMRNRGTSASLLRLHDPRAESRLCSSLLGGCTETKRHIPVSNPHDRHAQLSGCWGA